MTAHITDRPLIYVAGPYRASTINQILKNIWQARLRAEWLWTNGYVPIVPHLNGAFMDGAVPDEILLSAHLEILSRCDGVLMVEGWEMSEGSKAEHKLAVAKNMLILYDPMVVKPGLDDPH